MKPDVRSFLDRHGVPWRTAESLDDALPDVDAVYMTRIQDEYDGLGAGEHVRADDRFRFRLAHLDAMKPHAALLHPLPKRDEIEPEVDYVDDARVAYWRQERNGMWMRVALLARLFKVDDILTEAHAELGLARST
jgi:aspartate carbamoyltransferase catalytic subunit